MNIVPVAGDESCGALRSAYALAAALADVIAGPMEGLRIMENIRLFELFHCFFMVFFIDV